MRAYVLPSFDEPAALTEVPTPRPGQGELLVRVLHSSVNPSDVLMARGFFTRMEHRFPAVLGRDLAGVVEDTGPGVDRFRPGDRVFGFVKRDHVGDGTFAEYVVVPADRFVVPRPAEVPPAAAGVLGVAGATAVQCVTALACAPGETVLVAGATGGVGAFAVQFARRRGLRVVATAHGVAADKHVRALGADATVDWHDDLAGQVRAVSPAGVHGIVDLVSPDVEALTTLAAAVLLPGRAVAATRTGWGGGPPGLTVHGIHCSPAIDVLTELAAAELTIPIAATFPLEKIADAFAALAEGPLGKVGLDMS